MPAHPASTKSRVAAAQTVAKEANLFSLRMLQQTSFDWGHRSNHCGFFNTRSPLPNVWDCYPPDSLDEKSAKEPFPSPVLQDVFCTKRAFIMLHLREFIGNIS